MLLVFVGGETLDECGLKFLLAVRLHTFLTTSLPAYRAQLLHQGDFSSNLLKGMGVKVERLEDICFCPDMITMTNLTQTKFSSLTCKTIYFYLIFFA